MPLLEFDDSVSRAKIKVIGVGGGGGNAVNSMIQSRLEGVEFVAANTDLQALEANLASAKIPLGNTTSKGLGAGANPMVGRNAALEDVERIAELVAGADMVFIAAGMGGGTGTGAAPIIAQIARQSGALTVGVVTKPFSFEGKRRRRQAEEGITALAEAVDSLVVIPNERLLGVAGENMTMLEAFRCADQVLLNGVQGISDLITVAGHVNLDFADVKSVMSNMGRAMMGTGRASGEGRAIAAAKQAISSPLLEDVSIQGATGILINFTGGPDMKLSEVQEAAAMIEELAHEDCNTIFGSVFDANINDEIRVTVIATGFDKSREQYEAIAPQATQRQGQLPLLRTAPVVPQAPTIGQISHNIKMAAQKQALVSGIVSGVQTALPVGAGITRQPPPLPGAAFVPLAAPAIATPQNVLTPQGSAPEPLIASEAAQGSGPVTQPIHTDDWDVVIDDPAFAGLVERRDTAKGARETAAPVVAKREATERGNPPPPGVNRAALAAALGDEPADEMDIPAYLRRQPPSITT